MSTDILVFAAHPDDAELNCGGTIAALVAQGHSVGIVDMTQGEMGTRGTTETRKLEAQNASEILGITYRVNLDLKDSHLENTRDNQLKIIEVVREQRPKICITGAPHDRHPDHGKSTQLCIDALFYSGLTKIATTDTEGNKQSPWRPDHILHYMQDRPFEPDFVFDISEHWETKMKATLAFATQFNVSDPGNEPETYISSQKYFKQLEARARYFGHLAGFEFGEPFRYMDGPMGLKDFKPFVS
jgi:bacillithiol biosynthesis deacetylase BshB1